MQPRLDRAIPDGYQRAVPPAPSDRRLLVFTGAIVILAGALFAGVLFFSTGGGDPTPKPGPIYIGLESDLRNSVTTGGPLYFAHPFGGTGFWLAIEDHQLVALVARRPGTASCTAKWESHRNAYIDCHNDDLTSKELNRYPIQMIASGAEKGGIIINFARVTKAPEPLPAKR
jgi:hypothetical protein